MAESATGSPRLDTLEQWSPTAFLIAGALLVVFAALLGVEAFMNRTVPSYIFGPAGFLVAMVGILGIYPTLADQSSQLVRAVPVLATIAAVGWFVVTVLSIGEAIGALPPLEDAGLLGLLIILVAGIAMVLAYIACGIAGLGVDAPSRNVSLLLLGRPLSSS